MAITNRNRNNNININSNNNPNDNLKINQDPRVPEKWEKYPKHIIPKLNKLRALIMETAKDCNIEEIEEALKWGEPSYLVKKGSTIRMDWKTKTPDQYAMYFKCTSKLVLTFKEVFGDTFNYETTRAIVFKLEDKLPEHELKQCIAAALNYHRLKGKPLLGMDSNVNNLS